MELKYINNIKINLKTNTSKLIDGLDLNPLFSWSPWNLFRFFKVCSDAKERERGAERTGKLPQLAIPSKTTTLVPELAMEDLPLSRTAALVSEFAVVVVVLGFTTPLTSQIISVAFYSERGKSDKFCSEALISA